jgi:hypothetical protein
MSRFIAFEFEHYYPGGGLNDSVGEFESLEEALKAITTSGHVLQVPELMVHVNHGDYGPMSIEEFRRKLGS